MEDVNKSGRTILFVSHDLTTVEKLCTRTILLQVGSIHMMTETLAVVNHYLHKNPHRAEIRDLGKGLRITKFTFGEGKIVSSSDVSFNISFSYDSQTPFITEFCILIYTLRGSRVAIIDLRDKLEGFQYSPNKISIRGSILKLNLVEGDYQVGLHYEIDYIVGEVQDITRITVEDNNLASVRRYLPQYRGIMELDFKLVKSND